MSSHGPHFDEFHASPTHGHGGAEFDEFGKPTGSQAGTAASGEASTLQDHKSTSELHGAHWDDFGWRDLQVGHGHSFDSDFRQPAALDGSEDHGTWFDVFRGGTQVKAIAGGDDIEGTVTNVRDDHVIVQTRDGRNLELGLQQLRAFKHVEATGAPDRKGIKTAHVETGDGVAPASSAHAPSAHDAKARGGGRTAITLPDTGSKTTGKTDVDELDVAKMLRCAHCDAPSAASIEKPSGTTAVVCTSNACRDKAGVDRTSVGKVDVAKTLEQLRGLVADLEA